MMTTREEWATLFLHRLDAPVNRRNLLVLISWMQAEGGSARFNPLNTTKNVPDATDYNWVGVKNYPTLSVGLDASVATLEYGASHDLYGYRPIRKLLRAGARPKRTLRAVERSDWGTGGLALKVLPFARRSFEHYASVPISGS